MNRRKGIKIIWGNEKKRESEERHYFCSTNFVCTLKQVFPFFLQPLTYLFPVSYFFFVFPPYNNLNVWFELFLSSFYIFSGWFGFSFSEKRFGLVLYYFNFNLIWFLFLFPLYNLLALDIELLSFNSLFFFLFCFCHIFTFPLFQICLTLPIFRIFTFLIC